MKRTTITIKVAHKGQRHGEYKEHEIAAYMDDRAPHLAIHRPIAKTTGELLAADNWTVSHVKTGYRVLYGPVPTRREAIAYAIEFQKHGDFSLDDPRAVYDSFTIPLGQAVSLAIAAAAIA